MRDVYLKAGFVSVLSIAISVAITAGVFAAFGLGNPGPSVAMAIVCPLLIAPPISLYWFYQGRKTDLLCAELAKANEALKHASDRFENMARRDGMTGLLNRRAFFEAADIILKTQPAAMLMIDADHFKKINDVHGHAAGDAALIAIANAIIETCPADVLAARLGGEEFAVLAPGVGGSEAAILADLIRARVAATASVGSIPITVSAGVAAGEIGVAVDTLYRAADERLFEAKRAGRNRTELNLQALAA